MKKILLVTLTLSLLIGMAFAQEMIPAGGKTPVSLDHPGVRIPASRAIPAYSFTVQPTALITSYYDYMIGSYNGIPLRTIPESEGGGYFMTYHGKRQATSTRRVFYAYIDASGNIVNNNEITDVQNNEGYASLAVDPVSGKPLYAWHANGDADAELEIQFSSDAFIAQIAGLFNDVQNVVDNPITTTSIHGPSADNDFSWPTAQIGPSPVAGKRRVYLAGRNSVTHNHGPSENPIIAYADFNASDIENGVPMVWSYTFIPEMNDWNMDQGAFRRPFHAITTDNAGNVYYAGYHVAYNGDGTVGIDEPDMDVFKCTNYGQGTWTRVSASGNIPSWNPPESATSTVGYFSGDLGVYPDSAMTFNLANSSHLNATVDSNGKIHVPAIWAFSTNELTYYPNMQFVKEFVYNPATNTFAINEIYPQKDPADTHNECFTPWDMEAPWGVVDEYNPDGAGGFYPSLATDWPFAHWDQTAHTDAMMFHYNNIKVSEANSDQMMVAVWQNSWRALQSNRDSNPDYLAFANVPEIYLSVSPNNGGLWSEPIVLNNVEVPAMTGIKPMWVYAADKVKYVGMQGDNKVGKIGMMMYNDYTWGSNAITPAYHPNPDGGQVMFMELQIVFPTGSANNDNTTPVVSNMLNQNYPNPFNPETTISFNLPMASQTSLNVYNVKGQLVKTLVNSQLGFGNHSIVWNGTDNNGSAVTSGVYYYRLNSANSTETRKMVLVK